MKFIAVAAALFLASITHAAPFTERRRQAWLEKTSRRAGGLVRSARPLAVNYSSIDDQLPIHPSKNTQYNSNWAVSIHYHVVARLGTLTLNRVLSKSPAASRR